MTRRGTLLSILFLSTCAIAQPASTTPTTPATTPPTPAPTAPATPPPPPEIRVTLKSGTTWDGLLIRKDDRIITLLISGIETNFDRDQVKETSVLPAIEDRYLDIRASIEDTDIDGIVTLADWLRIRQRYTLALEEVSRALALDPEHAAAKRLKIIIEQQQILAAKSAAPANPTPAAPSTPKSTFPLLSDRDLALLKVYEVDLANPGRILIPRPAIDALIARYGTNPAVPQTREGREALYKANPATILEVFFRAQARDLYPEIKVADLPASLRRFRDDVNRTWLVNSCATTACHGGEHAGRLRLTDDRPSSDQTSLTSMLILDRFRIKPAMRPAKSDGPVEIPLIDYSKPAESPLLTFGLPPSDTNTPHPGAGAALKGWRPAFQSRQDPKFLAAIKWIESMIQPRPDYPIEYTAPQGSRPNSSAPSANPAADPAPSPR
jgi:hypothetical protein